MVKKKSFWLTLLAVLTAAVMVFGACGLAACSSESDDAMVESVALDKDSLSLTVGGSAGSLTATVKMSDDSAYGGDYTWSSSDTSVATVSGSGNTATVTAVAQGSATIKVEVSGSKSASCAVSVSTAGGGSESEYDAFTLWGYTNLFGNFWSSYEFNDDGTGYIALYQYETDTTSSGGFTISLWYYADEEKTVIEGIYGGGTDIDIIFTLSRVNGEIVAASVYTPEFDHTDYLYEESVLGALESTDGSTQVVLYKNYDCAVVMMGMTLSGTWGWTTEDESISVIVTGAGSYSATVTTNVHGQITGAEFATLGTFIQMGTTDKTLYSFESEEGYTLVMDVDGMFETVVDGVTYTGSGSTTTLTLGNNYSEVEGEWDEDDYTPTLEYDTEDPTLILTATYAKYFGGKTNVVFYLPENVPVSVYDQFLTGTYNGDTRGDAVAVFTGIQVKDDESGNAVRTDEYDYWVFLYRDGSFVAHIYEDFVGYGKTDGTWTWAENDESELVPTFIRNPGAETEQINYAYKNADGTYSVEIEYSSSRNADGERTGAYFVYTFDLEDMPAGVFAGSTEGSETTYVIIMYGDGTFRCHVPQTGAMPAYGTSTGIWSKDENGDMSFYKTASDGTINGLCTVTENAEDNSKLDVQVTNSGGTVYTYVVDPTIVPAGGHVLTDEELAKIEELEEAAQGGGEENEATVVATLYSSEGFEINFSGMELKATDVTLTLNSDGSASLNLTIDSYTMPFNSCSYTISGNTITLSISTYTPDEGTITWGDDGSIASIAFTVFVEKTQSVTFTAVNA